MVNHEKLINELVINVSVSMFHRHGKFVGWFAIALRLIFSDIQKRDRYVKYSFLGRMNMFHFVKNNNFKTIFLIASVRF